MTILKASEIRHYLFLVFCRSTCRFNEINLSLLRNVFFILTATGETIKKRIVRRKIMLPEIEIPSIGKKVLLVCVSKVGSLPLSWSLWKTSLAFKQLSRAHNSLALWSHIASSRVVVAVSLRRQNQNRREHIIITQLVCVISLSSFICTSKSLLNIFTKRQHTAHSLWCILLNVSCI